MHFKFHTYLLLLALIVTGVSCKKDNYKAPSVTLKGRIVYKGEPVNVEYDRVTIELYQPGFGKTGPISGTFGQDGDYSFLLFDGNYKLIIPKGQGPFIWNENAAGNRDSLAVAVNGDQTLDLNVTPYYLIQNAKYTVASNNLAANFSIAKIITDANAKDIEAVTLFVNKTQFVSGASNIASTSVAGSSIADRNNVSLTATIPAITPTQNYVFARVGLKIAGVEDLIFSPLQKIQL